MTTVVLYGGVGKFTGTREYQWVSPEVGDTHKFILFMAQESEMSLEAEAMKEMEKFGFAEIRLGAGKPIHVEVLNQPQMQAFQRHYEGALAEGSSIVWYPNAPDGAA
jgi:hypothetical protein